MSDDPARWLETARAVHPRYPEAVMARHRAAATEYGDTWRSRPMPVLAAEVREEGLDVGGWAMLVGARLDELTPELRAEVTPMVLELVSLGARSASLAARLQAKLQHG